MRDKLIIFDCDGVLVDSEIICCEIEAEELCKIGYDITSEEVAQKFLGKSHQYVLQNIEQTLGKPAPDSFSENLNQRIHDRMCDELQPTPGITDFIDNMIHYCLASSGAPQKINRSLRLTGLNQYFSDDRIFSATMVKNGKPAPDLFLHASNKMGFAPSECVVIEDSPAGITAAKAAGMTAIGYTGASHLEHGKDNQELTNCGAHKVFEHLGDIETWLNTI